MPKKKAKPEELILKLYEVTVKVVAYDKDSAMSYINNSFEEAATSAFDSGEYDDDNYDMDSATSAAGEAVSVKSLGKISKEEAKKIIGFSLWNNGFIEPSHST